MTPPTRQNNIRDIALNADIAMLVKALEAQYAHMSQDEARKMLENVHDTVWNSEELMAVFEVSHFDPPLVHVIRKTDGCRGTVVFVDSPRLYFSFQETTKQSNHVHD
jgi:hypothetical protein